MSLRLTLSILATALLSLALSGCGWLKEMQYKAGLQAFRITEAAVDAETGELTLSWQKAQGAETYKVWVSRSRKCSSPRSERVVDGTSYNFGRVGPGQYFGCVAAVLEVQVEAGNTCSLEATYVSGKSVDAKNQGKPFAVTAQKKGTWTLFAKGYPTAELLATQGGIILQASYPLKLHVINREGVELQSAKPLPLLQNQKTHYAYVQGALVGFIADTRFTQVMLWNEASAEWRQIGRFTGLTFIAHHLMSPEELAFVLYDAGGSRANWYSLNSSDPEGFQVSSTVPLASQLGNVFYNTGSVFRDNGFVIADDRGVHRLTPTEMTTLVAETGMSPDRMYTFPGSRHEYLIRGKSLRIPQVALGLICTYIEARTYDWWSWDGTTLTKLTREGLSGFVHATSDGPLSMESAATGTFLQNLEDGRPFFTAPPFSGGRLLDGPQGTGDEVLVANSSELWIFTRDAEPEQ